MKLPRQHRHVWVATSVTAQTSGYNDPRTIVLYRCECTATKTRKMKGTWTVADLNPPSQ